MTDELYIWLSLLIALLASILLLVVIYKLGRKFKNSQHDIYLYSFLTIFVLLITSFTYFHSKFLIMPTTGPSMLPNMKNTYYILARDYYLKNNINYGDVVIIEPSIKTKGLSLVKRVVGLSDDKVQIKNGYLFINDKIVQQKNDGKFDYLNRMFNQSIEQLKEDVSYKILNEIENSLNDHTYPIIIPRDHSFVLGDNRDASSDSRNFGPFQNSLIRHKVLFIEPQILARIYFILLSSYDLSQESHNRY